MQIPISGIINHLSLPKKMLGFNIKTAQQIQAQCKLIFVEFLKRHEMKKLEFCITLPALKMLNPILSSNRVPRVLEHLKTVKNSNPQKLYRNNLTNLH